MVEPHIALRSGSSLGIPKRQASFVFLHPIILPTVSLSCPPSISPPLPSFTRSLTIMPGAWTRVLVLSLVVLLHCCSASSVQPRPRFFSNATDLDACKALSPQSKVSYPFSAQYTATTTRYMTTSSQNPTCVFVPTLASELSDAIKLIGQRRVQFAVSSGKHASNQGFSSTTGIHISMKGFQQVTLSADKSYVDVGPGNIWDNVYQVLNGVWRGRSDM